jgi:hypothetical protein
VAHHLFEDDVDGGAPLVFLAGGVAAVFATALADVDGGELDGLDRAGVAGASIV